MSSRPTPQHAAEALRNIDRRTAQGVGSLRESPRWLDVVAGLVLLVYSAVPDFAPRAATYTNAIFAAVVVGYATLSRTRRGSALLGRPTRVNRGAVSPRFGRIATAVIVAVFLASLGSTVILGAMRIDMHIPYLGTVLGVASAVLLIGFGPRLRGGLARLAGGGGDGR